MDGLAGPFALQVISAIETATPVPRIVVGVLGSLTVLLAFLVLTQLRKNKELIKARLFLLYDRIHQLEVVILALLMAGIAVHLGFTLGVDPNFATWERFLASGIYAALFYAGAVVVTTIIFLILYPVGRPPKGGS